MTGATGFVGTRLVPRLEAAGARVSARDRDLDVTDPEALARAVAELVPDVVVHLAARSSVAASREDAAGAYRVTYAGAVGLLRAVARHAPGARVLLVGSGEIYGSAPPGATPWTEAAPLRPSSPYAWAKAAADLLGEAWATRGLDVVRARPFNHTGPGQRDVFVASSFARQLAELEAGRRPPQLHVGNLDSVRDFLPVDDVVEAYLALLDPSVPADAYNVCSGRGCSVRTLLDRLLSASRARPEIRVDPARVRPTDVSVGSAERLTKATGWSPRSDLDTALAALLDDWRRRLSADA